MFGWADCAELKPFTCVFETEIVTGKQKKEIIFQLADISTDQFNIDVWWGYNFTSQDILDNWVSRRMTGFSME